jgi:hypothetical protein
MKSHKHILSWFFMLLLFCWSMNAQQTASLTGSATVPRLVNFSGKATDLQGKAVSGIAGATFAIYKEESGGSPLWLETQNVQADTKGYYTVQLGTTKPDGLPQDLFSSGEARWLGVTVNGGQEQPRVLLLSVPYALKAADAETLGGKPLSAFQLATPQPNENHKSSTSNSQAAPATEQPNEIICSSGTACKTGFVPLFASNGGSAKVSDSIVSQSGTTVKIAGTETTTGTISSGGDLDASGNVNATGNAIISGNITASGLITGGFVGATNGSGAAIVGTSHGTSAGSDGVDGVTTSSTASGVAGINQSGGIGVYGVGGTAVAGFSSSTGQSSAGVYGQAVVPHVSTFPNNPPAGVWGDTGLNGGSGGVGVLGTADDHIAGLFFNNSPSGWWTLSAGNYDSSGFPFIAWNKSNNTSCNVDPGGNLNCTGQKHAIVPIDGGKRRVAMSSIEAPQSWFEDAGSTQLVNGAAIVTLDPNFIQTVNTEMEYNVFLTPYGDCKGLYVTNRTAKSFEVHELGGGTASLSFGYRIMALRRNYENVRFEDHTNDPDAVKMLEQMGKAKPAASSAPASLKPASPARAGVPVAEPTKR